MNLFSLLAFASGALCVVVALSSLLQRRKEISHWTFFGGLLILAIERTCGGFSLRADSLESVLAWQQWRLTALGLLPAPWLVFSLTYARGNARAFLSKWWPVLVAVVALPAVLVTLFRTHLTIGIDSIEYGPDWIIKLGWAGVALYVLVLTFSVLVLVNLERTFRAAVGMIRWRIKFVVLGAGVLFLVRVYTTSQALLYRDIGPILETVNSIGTVVALAVLVRGLFRAAHFTNDVYPSLSVIQGSLTITLAGVYLLVVGVLAKIVAYLGGDASFALKAFLVLISLVGLAVLLQSDRLQLRLRRFVSRNFQRPIYDYRTIWRRFTEGTAACVEPTELCRSIVRITAGVFQSLAVSLWLINDRRDSFSLAASTTQAEAKTPEQSPTADETREILDYFEKHPEAIDIETRNTPWAIALRRCHPSEFPHGGNRLCVPLLQQGQLLGLITLGDRVSGVAFPLQDFDLLKCIADQAAASLLNLQMSQQLLLTKELEAFQTMATFFVHDLKNAASTLHLMLQNLPVHFADPQFREDSLRGIGKSVGHINNLIGRLSSLRHELTLERVPCDLNKIVAHALSDVEKAGAITITRKIHDLPPIRADQAQLQKVAVNLVLNAAEAVTGRGEIHVSTARRESWVILTVSDNGCGMSPEFVRRSLFRPFQTTKKNGLGIGMFQSRMIVEAHGGRISVVSEQGKGTTFEVHLPVAG